MGDARLVWLRQTTQDGLDITKKQWDGFLQTRATGTPLSDNDHKASDVLSEYVNAALRGFAIIVYLTPNSEVRVSVEIIPEISTVSKHDVAVGGGDKVDSAIACDAGDGGDAGAATDATGTADVGATADGDAGAGATTALAVAAMRRVEHATRAVVFIKGSDGRIPVPRGEPWEIHTTMCQYTEYSVLCGNALVSARRLLQDIYLMMLDPELSQEHLITRSAGARSSSGLTDSGAASEVAASEAAHLRSIDPAATDRNELVGTLHKFVSQISHAEQQIHGDINLPIPHGVEFDPNNWQAALENPDIMSKLEEALDSWIQLIGTIIDQENAKTAVDEEYLERSVAPRESAGGAASLDISQGDQTAAQQQQQQQQQHFKSVRQTHQGPSAEIAFWRNRNAVLSTLFEQLQAEDVKAMLKALEACDTESFIIFEEHMAQLAKLATEAKDNVKFLATLERHFKNMESGNLNTILETIPSMMNALRMVWIISRHYNKDERMCPMMQLIAIEIAEKVSLKVNVRSIFRIPPPSSDESTAMTLIKKAVDVLDIWERSYMEAREKIERSGTEHRWEFDRKKLFDQTKYMSKICSNLYEVAQTLEQFHRFLGPELKAVTGNAEGINDVIKQVDALRTPLEILPFNAFDRRYNSSWEQVMTNFAQKVKAIEARTKEFVDTSFQKLRSAEGAFNLLQDFKSIDSRESIRQQMMEKFEDILVQFSREVDIVKEIFRRHKDKPPVSRNQPPVAGAIGWARSLYHRMKHVILRFMTMDGLLQSAKGKEVSDYYVEVAQEIDDYETELFTKWCNSIEGASMKLKEPILKRVPLPNAPKSLGEAVAQAVKEANVAAAKNLKGGGKGSSRAPAGTASGSGGASKNSGNMSVRTQNTSMLRSGIGSQRSYIGSGASRLGGSSRLYGSRKGRRRQHEEPPEEKDPEIEKLKYELKHTKTIVNFGLELRQLIRETKYLDRLGFDIPPLGLNVALQEDKYYECNEKLKAMLKNYAETLGKLSEVERTLMLHRIRELHGIMQPGFVSINWNALGIRDYIESCSRGIQDFLSVVNRMQKNSVMIASHVSAIRRAELVDVEEFRFHQRVMSLEEFAAKVEKTRVDVAEKCQKQYKLIPSMLMKIEEIVARTNTGNSPVCAGYYKDVELRIYGALITMIVKSMGNFRDILSLYSRSLMQPSTLGLRRQLPVIIVRAEVNAPEIRLSPPTLELYKTLNKVLKNVVATAKQFVRWLDGSCKECSPVPLPHRDDQTKLYTFYDDLHGNALVIKCVLSVSQLMHKAFNNANKFADQWRDYDEKYYLWNQKRWGNLDRLRDKTHSIVYFDDRLKHYKEIAESVENLPDHKNTSFLQIDVFPLISSIRGKARQWSDKFGQIMYEGAAKQLRSLEETMASLDQNLHKRTATMDELQSVLQTVSDVQSTSMDMNLQFVDVVERYRTLKMYGIPFDDEEQKLANSITDRWEALVFESKVVDRALLRVKERFADVTKSEAETFSSKLVEVRKEFMSTGPGAASVSLEDGAKMMDKHRDMLQELSGERAKLSNAATLFSIPIAQAAELQFLEDQMEKFARLYEILAEHQAKVTEWSGVLWSQLNVEQLEHGSKEFIEMLEKLPEDYRKLETYRKAEERIVGFKESLPLIASLKQESVRARHWETLIKLSGADFEFNLSSLTLGRIFSMELNKLADKIGEVTTTAMQEAKIEKALADITAAWSKNVFPLSDYKNGVTQIMSDTSDVQAELEDNVLSLQTLQNSRYIGFFRDQVAQWERDLNLVTECIKVWTTVQQKWMYLEGIFVGSEDIRQQLREATKNFHRIDTAFKKTMTSTAKNPNVLTSCRADKRLESLKHLSTELDACQKSLSDYLETKRNAFPRFFFISDDELLSILGNSDPLSVQVHMMKLFVNVKSLKFIRGQTVGGMVSSEGESFDFKQTIPADGAVEKWMVKVEEEMHHTLHVLSKEAVFYYPTKARAEWIQEQLGMVAIAGTQIWWTWEVEDAFRSVQKGNKYALKQLAARLTEQLNDLVAEVRNPDLTELRRKKINTLIIIDVHARDIVDRFVRDSILDAREFEWESQLRFYWDRSEDDIRVRQCTGEFGYGYEYMGLNGRLVITPLTDRCVMTLSQALTFFMGGAPAGPAGTGKTETVKDLAKSLAIPCFVTNCGEGLDYKAMGSIFSGLVQTGAWGCFDEFNRIELEVLSVVSTQLRIILRAVREGKKRFAFMGRDIVCNPRCGFFITMNPGYAGRTELPDNLKVIFRPVTMIVPDMLQICEIMLFSEGFSAARVLAKKMTVLYRLAKEQLSKQYHYDFGLRALKSVLVMAGALKRSADLDEAMVLMRAMRDMNLPKFVFEDVPLFLGLIDDLFPGMDCPRVGNKALISKIRADLTGHGFKCSDDSVHEKQVDKCLQLYETMLTRHTCMVVGPTQGGKSVVINSLARSLHSAFGTTVKTWVLNPKAQSVVELYGNLNPVTRDWTNGLLSKMFKECNEPLKAGANEVRWIVFDGDVDALWVENMNSVMDDNKLLTLPNGERIMLQDHVKLLVEVADLQYASPATVSRCGMVYVDPKNLGYRPYYEKWVRGTCAERSQAEAETLLTMFEKYVNASIAFCEEGTVGSGVDPEGALDQVIPIVNTSMVRQLCALYSSLSALAIAKMEAQAQAEEAKAGDKSQRRGSSDQIPFGADENIVESFFVFCLVWSVGGALTGPSRERFSKFVQSTSHRPLVDSATKMQLPKDSLYDFYFDMDDGRWTPWGTRVQDYVPPMPMVFAKIVVPTVDTVRNGFLLEQMTSVRKPLLFVGESGTAKTVTIQSHLASLDEDQNACLTVNFSSRTTSLDMQRTLMDNIEKRGPVWSPPGGKNLIVFVDDLNMPKVDEYGTQQPIALLKFLVERGKLYERDDDLELMNIRDLDYISAMAPPGGGRNPVDPRFIALFNVFNVVFPAEESLMRIYSSILETHLVPFPSPVQDAGKKLTPITMKFYQELISKMPATPSKFHYIFNLRDLSRVYEGVLQSTPDKFDSAQSLVRLWRNECLRVFHDRMISHEDKNVVQNELLATVIKSAFPGDADVVLADPILFGDFRPAEARLYEDVSTYENAKTCFDECLKTYNDDHKPMNLVLFQDALEHLVRIHRMIRMPRGNALLVGFGGSGKQSLTRLAAHAAGYKFFEIQLTRTYDETDFREDLKKLYNLLGVEKGGSPVVFLFTDAHVVDEGFLELINNMLTSGMVPALFDEESKPPIIDAVRDEVRAQGVLDNKENCWNYFVNKCRDNLHLVLSMSPAGDTLRTRCRNFPGLVSNTVIDWFFPWPEDALVDVANHFIRDVDLPKDHRAAIVKHIVSVHMSVTEYSEKFELEMRRKNSVTPKNYLDFLSNYKNQLRTFRAENEAHAKRLSGGLEKLIQAAESVDELREQLTEKKVVVDQKSRECADMIAVIKERSAEVSKKQSEAQEQDSILKKDAIVIKKEKALAEEALEEALPALALAGEALKNLKSADIAEVKALANPPNAVKLVCACVMELKPSGTEDASQGWAGAKAMLADTQFLNKLKNYPRDDMTEKMYKNVMKILKKKTTDPKQALTLENLDRISKAGKGMLQWVESICMYYEVAKNVAPRRKAVQTMERKMADSQRSLSQIKKALIKLEAEINQLSADYGEKSSELKDLQEQAEQMEKYLNAAAKLIDGLSSERTRWTAQKEDLSSNAARLVGDCLLTSSFLSYTGAFTFGYRKRMVYDDWLSNIDRLQIPLTTPFRLESLLVKEVEISQWISEGLPSDELSIQNGILTTRASRFPLCIDPQMQALHWIQEKEGEKLNVKSFNDPDFLRILELSVQYGNPFMFDGVDEEIDPIIDPILEKNFVMNQGQKQIVLGDKQIDFDDDFRLYLVSKLSNPRYSPEVAGKTMIINYSVTLQGLEDQLLDVVVGFERPDLQEQREELIHTMSKNSILLADLEEVLLRELTGATGNILENKVLIQTLEDAKSKSVSIAKQQEESKDTALELEKVAAGYRLAAKRGSILFFSMASMSNVSRMYEYSLSAYLELFRRALDVSEKDAIIPNRLLYIIDCLTKMVYDYVCTGIFERHKLMFSLQMCSMIMDGEGTLSREELDFFLKGNISLGEIKEAAPAEWVPKKCWKDLQKLYTLGAGNDDGGAENKSVFGEFLEDFRKDLAKWETWYALEKPEDEALPGVYEDSLTKFQKLCVLRCFRPDRVYNGVRNFVMEQMKDDYYVQPPTLEYEKIFSQSTPTSPVVFILSPGADPMDELEKLADRKEVTKNNRFRQLSLGQGQGEVAQSLLEVGSSRGYWVVLQNCHLMPSWLRSLEKSLDAMKNPHKDFRLWLTTDPTPNFPIGILQSSFKVVTEPPDGLKLNLKQTFAKVTQQTLEQCPHGAWKSLLYVLAFFHAVVQERKKYGKLGWNVSYDFNESDFNVSKTLLELYLTKAYENNDKLPWGSLRYLIGEAMYGGRVTDSFDRRVLITYLNEYMGDFLFDDFQPFFFSKSGFEYKIPTDGQVKNYTGMIGTLPLECSPQVFGLHSNAEIDYYSNATKSMWINLINLQPRSVSSGGGVRREDYIEKVASDIESQVPEPFDLMVIRKFLTEKCAPKTIGPTTVVLLQELERWNVLVERMSSSLVDLKRALVGEIGMSKDLDDISSSLFNGFIPESWRRLMPDTQKMLGSWMAHFKRRYNQYEEWSRTGEDPKVMWLSGLHIPESYLTALVQTTCRKRKWPLDKSTLYTVVTTMTDESQVEERMADGCYVSGLYLEGAGWDDKAAQLKRQEPKKLSCELPILKVIPIETSKLKLQNTFKTPVYVTQNRRSAMGVGLVFEADLSTSTHASHWILQGTALSLNTDA